MKSPDSCDVDLLSYKVHIFLILKVLVEFDHVRVVDHLQDLHLGLEALPVLDLRALDRLDGSSLPVLSVSSGRHLSICPFTECLKITQIKFLTVFSDETYLFLTPVDLVNCALVL